MNHPDQARLVTVLTYAENAAERVVARLEEAGDPDLLNRATELLAELTRIRQAAAATLKAGGIRRADALYGTRTTREESRHAKESVKPAQDCARGDQSDRISTQTRVPNRSVARTPEIEGSSNPGEVLGLPGRECGPVRPMACGELHGPDLPTLDGAPVAETGGQTHASKPGSVAREDETKHEGWF